MGEAAPADPSFSVISFDEALTGQREEPDLLVLSAAPGPARVWASRLRETHPSWNLSWTGSAVDGDSLLWAVNEARFLRIWPRNPAPDEVKSAAAEGRARRLSREASEKLRREFGRKNRRLEEQTQSLEALVLERTASLEASAREESEKLTRERQIIRFLNDLAALGGVEEVLRLLRKEIRKFPKALDLCLALRPGPGRVLFLSFRGDQVLRSEGEDPRGVLKGPSAEDEQRQFFANHFGRPFGRALFIPLDVPAGSRQRPLEGLLAVEYSLMSEDEREALMEILTERLRPLSLVVDRLFIEDRQRRTAMRWERSFDSWKDPVVIIDQNLNVLRGNRAFTNQLMPKACYESFAGRSAPCEGCPVHGQTGSPEVLNGTIHVGHRIYQLRSYPLTENGEGRVTGRVHHYGDVTENRATYLRMLQNEKMGALAELAGHIAHELNNPLSGIRSLAQVLRHEYKAEAAIEADLQQIESAAQRCQKIIRHLLEFSSDGEAVLSPVSLDEVIEGTLPLLKTALRPHRQQMLLQARKARFMGDPHLLQQVVFNLINNACQAMKEAGSIGVQTRVIDGEQVELSVVDTGPGIPPELHTRIFEPFFTTKKEGEGTGLGLSLSRAIIEKMGGSLRVESDGRSGSRFIARWPLVRGGAP